MLAVAREEVGDRLVLHFQPLELDDADIFVALFVNLVLLQLDHEGKVCAMGRGGKRFQCMTLSGVGEGSMGGLEALMEATVVGSPPKLTVTFMPTFKSFVVTVLPMKEMVVYLPIL